MVTMNFKQRSQPGRIFGPEPSWIWGAMTKLFEQSSTLGIFWVCWIYLHCKNIEFCSSGIPNPRVIRVPEYAWILPEPAWTCPDVQKVQKVRDFWVWVRAWSVSGRGPIEITVKYRMITKNISIIFRFHGLI